MADEGIGKIIKRPITGNMKVIDDFTTVSKERNTIWTFSDFDVTDVRKQIKMHFERTGEKISFTAFLITCFARVVEKHLFPMNTMRWRRKMFYIFEEVDVMTNIERTYPSGVKKPSQYTVRKAQQKSLREIHDEIRAAQKIKEVNVTTGNKNSAGLAKYLPKMPRFIRRPIIRYILNDPIQKKKILGTVGVTAVGMTIGGGQGKGHMIHLTPHNLSMGVGSFGIYPMVIDGKTIPRDVLGVTLAMDHATIDGGPATRFFYDLREMVTKLCIEEDWCFKSL